MIKKCVFYGVSIGQGWPFTSKSDLASEMQKSNSNKNDPDKLPIIGAGLYCAFWLADSALDTFFFGESDSYFESLLSPEPVELWMRIVVLGMMVLVVFYARKTILLQQKLSANLAILSTELEQTVKDRTVELSKAYELLNIDITTSKQAENEFLRIFNISPDLVGIGSLDGYFTKINSMFKQMLGYEDVEFLSRPFIEFVHDDDIEETLSALTDAVEGKQNLRIQNRYRCEDGSYKWIEWNILALVKENIFYAAGRDITEHKQTEKNLRRIQKMDAIGQLTGGIAHDFNNILGIIVGNLGLIEKQPSSDKELMKRIDIITNAAKRASNLTERLLGFSRHQAVDVVVSNLNQVVVHMENMISSSITPEVEVNHRFSNELWLTAVNQGDFQDTLLNIILNARDAMPNGGQLTIETRNCTLDKAYCARHLNATPGEYAMLSVSDTGEGIASEQIDRIFEPFYTTKETVKGTGLGLSMVFGFIGRSSGHINVESELGVGTTFYLYLPRATGSAQPENITDPPPETMSGTGKKILTVDDEEDLLALTKEFLVSLGYFVLTASNGKEALEQLTEHPDTSLMLSDVIMPGGMSGYELAEQAMENHSNLKILLTSGHTEKAGTQVQQKYDLLTKPYTIENLAQRVQSLLDESKTVSE